jgi:hypothetical protein
MKSLFVRVLAFAVLLGACSSAAASPARDDDAPVVVLSPLASSRAAAVAGAPVRCPPRPFDATASLGPELGSDIFVHDESEAIATAFLAALETIYADPAVDVCPFFTADGWASAMAFDPVLRAVRAGETLVAQDHVLRIAFEGTYDLRDRPPIVPIDIIFDVPAGAVITDVASGRTRTSSAVSRAGFHVDFVSDGHRWRADRMGPVTAENESWVVLPTTPPPGPPCAGFVRDPPGTPFDDTAGRGWCDAGGLGRTIVSEQLVLLTRYPCDRAEAAVLTIGRPLGTAIDPLDRWEYVRDPAGEFQAQRWVTAPWDGDARLPVDAAATGWTNGNVNLWISPSEQERAVYLVRGTAVERWPRAAESWGVIDCN